MTHTHNLYPGKQNTLNRVKALFFFLFFLGFHLNSVAQIMNWDASNNGGGPSGFGISPWAPATLNANLSMVGTGLVRGSNITTSGTPASSSWGGSGGWSTNTDAGCVYFSFTANSGFKVSLTSLSCYIRRSSGGPPSGNVEYSLNGVTYTVAGGWTSNVTSGTVGQANTIMLSGISALQNVAAGTVIKLRFTFSSSSGNWYLLNGPSCLVLNGSVTAATPSFSASIVRTGTIQCNGQSNGQLTASVSGGTGPYTYSWMPSGQTASVASNLSAGVYTCIVKDAVSASTTATFNLVQPAVLAANIASFQDVTCNGGSDGDAKVTVSGGTAAYTYSWLPSGGSTATLSNAGADTYTVLVTDSKSCTTSETVTITEPSTITVISASVSAPVICEGSSILLSGSGAVSYTWTGGVTDGMPFFPTVTDTYSVTGADQDGCLGYASITVSVNPAPNISINSGAICPGDIYILTPGGAVSYTYSSGSATVSPVGTSTYSVTGTSTEGCVSLSPVVATVAVAASLSVTISGPTAICQGESANLVAGGASSYIWSTGDVTYTVAPSPGSATTYTVMGMSGSCSSTAAITVNVNSRPPVTVSGPLFVCSGSPAVITAAGAPSYSWNTGATSGSIVPTPTTVSTSTTTLSYTVTGTDLNNCSNTAVQTITVQPVPVISVNGGTVCAGSPFTFTPSGASTYTFSGGTTVSPTITTNYSVTGTSSLGCITTTAAVVTVSAYALPVVSVNSGSVCAGKTFTMSPNGAVTYTFSNGSSTVVPAASGSYSVTGTNSLGCVSASAAVANITVQALPVITVNSGTLCAGKVFTMMPAGAATYTYSNGSNTVIPTSNTSYSVTGTSSAGCVASASAVANVTVNPLPVITVGSGSVCSGSVFSISPSGASTYTYSGGSATVSPASTTSYSVSGTSSLGCVSAGSVALTVSVISLPTISISGATLCAGDSFTMMPSGAVSYSFTGGSAVVNPTATASYSVTGTATTGCVSQNAIVTLTVKPLPVLSIAGVFTICEGSIATLTASGANSYTWNTSFNTASVSVSPVVTTVYTVTGADANGCLNTLSPTVTVNTSPVLTMSNATICPGDSYTLAASGASSYTFSAGPVVTPAGTTTYSVTGTNTLGCVSLTAATAVITVTNTIQVAVSGQTVICNGLSANLTAVGATTYTWTNGTISPSVALSPSVTTNYTVTGSSGSCSNSAVISVSVMPSPNLQVASTRTTLCIRETATLSVSGATSYTWNTGNTASVVVVSPTTTTSYTITGTNSDGCTATKVVTQVVSNCTGVEDVKKAQGTVFSVFPNPSSGEFTIRSDAKTSFILINELGQNIRTIARTDFVNGETEVKNLKPGLYFIISSDTAHRITQKIIITR